MVERIVQCRFYGRLPLSSGLPPRVQAVTLTTLVPGQQTSSVSLYCRRHTRTPWQSSSSPPCESHAEAVTSRDVEGSKVQQP